MFRVARHPLFLFGAALVIAIVVLLLGNLGLLNTETWTRESPLHQPHAVKDVHDGLITLADGRAFRPAGVQRREAVTRETYDEALHVMLAQGVVIVRDLGDGRATLLAEPKFNNWCGTRGFGANPWGHWAGAYIRCPVSELLVHCGYATVSLEEAGLNACERARLNAVSRVVGISDTPTRVIGDRNSLDFDVGLHLFKSYDLLLEDCEAARSP